MNRAVLHARAQRGLSIGLAAVVAGSITTVVLLAAQNGSPGDHAQRSPQPSASVRAERTRVAELVEAHHCWQRDVPRDMVGKIPGHVVATLPSGRATYAADPLVGQALRQVFNGERHGLDVAGFCR